MEKIGFIGLGIMGEPMALNLIKAGHPVAVLATSAAANTLTAAGAQSHPDSASLAAASDIIITMLPDSPEVEAVAAQIIDTIRPGSLFIDMSTIAPTTAIALHQLFAAKSVEALDAPVSGGQVGAQNAALSIMVGGSADAFTRAQPLFAAMGKNIVHIGAPGAGQTTKTCNQIIVAMTIQAVAEAFTLAQKAGVDLVKMREVLLGGFAQSRILDLHGQRIIDRNFKPGFKVKLHRKDMNIALATGKQFEVPLDGSAQVTARMEQLIADGHGELDHSALALLLEQLSGITPA
ncbi:2-hydroxy-3-oxopropionate reductase [Phragmitibacter flavus]|uniref:2-hydroxy-3-oxopropionate reductase n=1 Tax=Phragmitibacter flavus TaxID=2576071 RepID=A0A5R8KB53_9BACT|nr:NAD(P)-binding domain-containing protein [Phragmitibacter flavus]TLD69487.1 2-hydroxy-3-oxopropionate reductase [Phragmitibacter flavus]